MRAWSARPLDRRRINQMILVGIILLTLPGYCAGLALLLAAPDRQESAPRRVPWARAAAIIAGLPTFTATPSLTWTPSLTPTPSLTSTVTPSETLTATPTLTPSLTVTTTPSPTDTATVTPSPTRTVTLSATQTPTPTPSDTPSPTFTATWTPSATPSLTWTPSATPMPYPPPPSLAPMASKTLTYTPPATLTPAPTVTAGPTLAAGGGPLTVQGSQYALWGCTTEVGAALGSPPVHNPLDASEAAYSWVRGLRWYHEGVDLSVPLGTPVHAAGSGTVIYAGWTTIGYGNLVVIAHGETFTLYGHLSQIDVTCGQGVAAGSVIGLIGSTGYSSGPHLHFEVRSAQWAVLDPLDWVTF